jgi:hypothetical protein
VLQKRLPRAKRGQPPDLTSTLLEKVKQLGTTLKKLVVATGGEKNVG